MTSNSMRLVTTSLLLMVSAHAVQAQNRNQEMFRRNHLVMLFEQWKLQPWVKSGGWIYEFDEALKKAKAEDKLIFAYFTKASDVPRRSQQIQRVLFSDPEFLKRKDNAVLFCHVYTQLEDRPYDDLPASLGLFAPTVAIMDANGKPLRDLFPTLERDVALDVLDSMREYTDVTKRLAAGEEGLEGKAFVVNCKLGLVNWNKAKDQISQIELTEVERKTIDSLILDQEILSWLAENASNRQAGTKAEIYGAFKSGRRPTANQPATYFWDFLLDAAEEIGDLETYKAAHKVVLVRRRALWEERVGSLRRPGDEARTREMEKRDIKALEDRLAEMIRKHKK